MERARAMVELIDRPPSVLQFLPAWADIVGAGNLLLKRVGGRIGSVTSDSNSDMNMTDRLCAAAQHHARDAMRLFSGEWAVHSSLDFAYRAGSVVELLSKMVLARRDERLLPKAAHEYLLDQVLGASARQARKQNGPTLDANVAAMLAGRVSVDIASHVVGAQQVLKVRNAAVHMAVPPDVSELRRTVTSMVVFVAAVLGAERIDERTFWGDHYDEAAGITRRHLAQVSSTAQDRVNKARQKHQQALASLPADAKDEVVKLLQARSGVGELADELAPFECPACGNEAQTMFDYDVDVEDDHGEPVYSSGYVLTGLACPVCDLRLDGEEVDALDLKDVPTSADVAEGVAERDFDDRYEYE